MELFLLLLFIFVLIIVPIAVFFMIRRVFKIFRFLPNLFNKVVVPSYEKMSTEQQSEGTHSNKMNLNEEQMDFIKNSFLSKQIEFNPKNFKAKTKKKLSIAALIIGLPALGFVLYKLFWVIHDFIMLTYF